MIIHKYDDEYATKNGTNGVKEYLSATIIAVIGYITPAILLPLKIINFTVASIIWIFVTILVVYFVKKTGVINKSQMSVLIEIEGDLYYMMITPDLRGSSLPKSFTALLAGPTATFVENKIDAEIQASQMAQDDEIVTTFFDLYRKGKIETTFDTVVYGKPIYVSKIIDKNFKSEYKKIYKVDCIKENGKKAKIKIPNVFPTFFGN